MFGRPVLSWRGRASGSYSKDQRKVTGSRWERSGRWFETIIRRSGEATGSESRLSVRIPGTAIIRGIRVGEVTESDSLSESRFKQDRDGIFMF